MEDYTTDYIDGKCVNVASEKKIKNSLSVRFFCLIFLAFRDTGSPTKLAECPSCGRTFNPTVLVGVDNLKIP